MTLDILNGIKHNAIFFDKQEGYIQVIYIKEPDRFLCKMYKNDIFRIFNSNELKKFERLK